MAESAHTEVPGGKREFPPFNKETFASQLVWLAVFFIALYVLMAKAAIPRLGGIIEARRGKIEGDLADASKLKDQSDTALKAYEKALADARGQAQAQANETRDRLNAEADKERKSIEAALNAKLAKAEEQIAATKTAAMSNVRGIAIDTASAIVQRLIGTAPSGAAVETAVTDALKG